ncbi:3278_t:CDS:2 [Acaulospora colombiana]|uniref:3278_t:CDS:1 n=1 Tax=Acaulospora colombiana TaxID=27376 RepID=A0ACA9MFB7_9GLOM|nr:3278_t:CDS:2 [Acaulospora colombiana]
MDLDETTMVSLLSRDDLSMEEEKIWDYLIKWGIKNTANLKKLDVSKWSLREFIELEKTLQRCIPLIRFWQLPPEVFNKKVKPFERIIPRNLQLRLRQRFLTKSTQTSGAGQLESTSQIPKIMYPTKERTIDSTIVTHQQAALIACWIDRKYIKDTPSYADLFPVPYYFRLLFRGSRDGFSAKTFHDNCDGQGATIVVVRVGDSKELIGGYNPIGWSSPRDVEWRGTRDSFIFSLGDGKDLGKTKLSRIRGDCVNDAIQLQDRLGPSFGFYELKITGDANEGGSSYASGGLRYEHKIRDKGNYFGVDDYEVFQVIKK